MFGKHTHGMLQNQQKNHNISLTTK